MKKKNRRNVNKPINETTDNWLQTIRGLDRQSIDAIYYKTSIITIQILQWILKKRFFSEKKKRESGSWANVSRATKPKKKKIRKPINEEWKTILIVKIFISYFVLARLSLVFMSSILLKRRESTKIYYHNISTVNIALNT